VDAKGADCWLETFRFDEQGFWPGLLSGALLLFLFFPIFYKKKRKNVTH
jgi:hypothetical protein